MAMIYRAPWKSHECPTRALSIPEVFPCLSDENKIVPTQISSLYAFLSLAPRIGFHSATCYLHFCALCETPEFFFCDIGCFDPPCVRSPLDTLESGVLFHIWWAAETFACFTRESSMESSVVSSLPDCTFNPVPRKHGGNYQL